MKHLIKLVISSLLLMLTFGANAALVNMFTEDFEGGLSSWTGQSSGSTTGQIVVDPSNSGNNVLNFSSVIGGGDIFSIDTVATTSTFTLSFDYMGTGENGGGDGFLGLSVGLPGAHT